MAVNDNETRRMASSVEKHHLFVASNTINNNSTEVAQARIFVGF